MNEKTSRQPMTKKTEKIGAVAVIGGGITGVQAALDLADMGFKIFLFEKTPAIGGVMAQLDKTFPTNDCSMCILSPKLVDCARHPNIQMYTNTDVEAIHGKPGNFTIKATKKPRYVDLQKCTACGSCADVCPIKLPNEYEFGLVDRKAIYKCYPQAIPNAYVIDKIGDGKKRKCVECMKCVEVCTSGAINHKEQPETFEVSVGAVIIAAGSTPFNPVIKPEFGYTKYKNVLTSIEFERILSASGPFQGKILRPSDQKEPKKIAWIHCVGSRDASVGNPYCSAMCCMYTAKEAVIAKEHSKHIEPTVFYIDIRSYGKDFDRYIDRAKQEHNIRYVRSRISEIIEDPKTKNLVIRYEDDCGELKNEVFDMVVLSVGLCSSEPRRHELLEKLGVPLNEFGFIRSHPDDPVTTNIPGVFVAGSILEPQAIPESVTQASAAAAKAAMLLADVRGTLVQEKTYPKERDVSDQEPRVGVFICHCGINIGGILDIEQLVSYTKKLPSVVHVEANLYSCSEDTQKKIAEAIKKHNLNRILVAACTPRTHEPLFQKSLRQAGLNPFLLEMTNIREQCSWVHMNTPKKATEKAEKLIAMNVAKTRLLQPIRTVQIPVIQTALIIGGGIAGMTAALSLADQGFETVLVEKENRLGGHLHDLFYTVDGVDIQKLLQSTTEKIRNHPRIKTYLNAQVKNVKGYVGNYESEIQTPAGLERYTHGVIVVATGVQEYIPTTYNYGKDNRILTQTNLEKQLATMTKDDIVDGETFVMIQCVESRDEKRSYCSRICCMQAVKNALKIKELNPKAEVFILYRDLMTYGFKEIFYKQAREQGIMFMQYDPCKKPKLEIKKELSVNIYEPMLQETVEIPAHHVILASGMKPYEDTERLAKLLKVPITSDGFFLEAHVKLRPVDFSTRGVFLAGCCHTPKFIAESIYQGQAAAARAGTLLSSLFLESEPNVAVVNKEVCSGCKTCIITCPYHAIDSIQEEQKGKKVVYAKVNEGLCQGCGTCVAACPAGAIEQCGFKDRQILPMVDEAV
ncbi:MAG: CoB--CoM heterodisulfide reductase iron-sulfur subunit A family protein [Candidatus Thermoplasmatota archaeon]